MSNKKLRKEFLNYLEGTLSEQEREEFERQLETDESFAHDLAMYRQVVQMEQERSRETTELDERFVSKVMAAIKHDEQPGFIRRLIMELTRPSKTFTMGVATCAMLVLCVSLVYGPQYEEYVGKKADLYEPISTSQTDSPVDDISESNIPIAPLPSYPVVKSSPGIIPQREGASSLKEERFRQQPARKDKAVGGRGANKKSAIDLQEERTAQIFQGVIDKVTRDEAKRKPAAAANEVEGIDYEDSDLEAFGEISIGELAPPADFGAYVPSKGNERYYEVTENSPVLTSSEPMSTFSIDVDTGSYTNARRYLRHGTLPPSESVRIEEFINYFTYDYPTTNEGPFAVNFEAAPGPDSDGRYLLKIGIKAQSLNPDADKRKPWNLVFLVDVSGSMSNDDKLPLVQRSLKVLTGQMRPGDKVSLVTYAGSSGIVLEPTEIKEKSKILQAIQRLSSGGSTHGSAGIHLAYQAAEQAFIKDGVNRVILATDGDFNVGITDQDQLIKLIEQKRKSGITLTTLGYGTGNYNEATMEQLANKGNGNYFYIDSFQEARKVFETDLYGTIEMVAKDVKLQIEFNPEHVAQYRLVGYENRKLKNQDFANDKIDAGEIGVGHTVTALYELVLVGTDAAKAIMPEYRYKKEEKAVKKPESEFTSELAFLKVRYKEPTASRSKLMTFPLNTQQVKKAFKKATTDFRFVAAVSAFAHKLRGSNYAPELTYKQIAEIASASKGEDKLGYRQEFIQLVNNASSVTGK